jgi:hypothetical protein
LAAAAAAGGSAVGLTLYIAAPIRPPQNTMRITIANSRKSGLSVGLTNETTTNPTMSRMSAAIPRGDTAALPMISDHALGAKVSIISLARVVTPNVVFRGEAQPRPLEQVVGQPVWQ